ncbi:MAG: 3-phosphoshikimate 1-carboxyvinyltransferase [Sphingobacteriaceae bacterium]|nr:3-phosphoshikimate 1-carboxyvinyltransferase [Sphingobacteriaceae bacterium]
MIKAIADLNFDIENMSDSDDTKLLIKALHDIRLGKTEINIGDAGTNMRFLCAYLSCLKNKTFTLTGSDRMKERPIKELVDALITIGAEITYLERTGFPPIKITGKELIAPEITMKADVSSQFISALLLVSPLLKSTKRIELNGEVVSPSYIKMTMELMHLFGKNSNWKDDTIEIKSGSYKNDKTSIYNESDWSAASYFYSALALGDLEKIELAGLSKNSVQADSKIVELYKMLGINSEFETDHVIISKTTKKVDHFTFDFTDCPDIAQTLAATCVGLRITADLTGLKTLKLKETDRIIALKNELQKFGALVEITPTSLHIKGYDTISKDTDILVNTYGDHRMAMSFAPLKFLYPDMIIENKEVVSKSFPKFWEEFSKLS